MSSDVDELELRAELQQIALLTPWTSYVAHDATLSDDLNEELRLRVQDVVFDALTTIYQRLARQQAQRVAAGLLPRRAARTLLESHMVVDAKRHVDVHRITTNVKMAMQTAAATLVSPTMRMRHEPLALSSPIRTVKPSTATQLLIAKRADADAKRLAAAAELAAVEQAQIAYVQHPAATRDGTSSSNLTSDAASSGNSDDALVSSHQLLSVHFPPRTETLAQVAALADAQVAALADPHAHITHFRDRPVSLLSVDANTALPIASSSPQRMRYIPSTRLGAVPPTSRILDEYAVPRAIVDALERQRHWHVDASSSSFDTLQVPTNDVIQNDITNNDVSDDDASSDYYIQRAVVLERPPQSFVLSSLKIACERTVPPPHDVFAQHVHASSSSRNHNVLLADVHQLFDSTHDAHRTFRATLHRPLALASVVDLAFRSTLNSTRFVVGGDLDDARTSANVPDEPSVCIPDRLQRGGTSIRNAAAKWRLAKSSVDRIAHRRGAIALHVQTDANTKLARTQLLHALCAFTPHDVQLMECWYTHEPDTASECDANDDDNYDGDDTNSNNHHHDLDPVAMAPALSARFDAVWHALAMPVHERLDLAVKYSAIDHSPRLVDAVALWEAAAANIREREELLALVYNALGSASGSSQSSRSVAALAAENAMLQDLATSSACVKELLLLTYMEVGDFVTLGGNFYLARMEHDATELRRVILESIESMKRQTHPNDHND